MNPRVFLADPGVIPGTRVRIDGADGHHFARVLRVQPGEEVHIASAGQGYRAEVVAVDAKAGSIEVEVGAELASHEPRCSLYLVQALAKGDKIDSILQHNTEVGVAGFLIAPTRHSVARLDARKVADRLARWRKIVHEAAGQAQRDRVPVVDYAATAAEMEAWLDRLAPDLLLFVDESEPDVGLRQALARLHRKVQPVVAALVGPEGGWDASERSHWVHRRGAVAVSLGRRILRTETAGLVTAAAVFHDFGDLGG